MLLTSEANDSDCNSSYYSCNEGSGAVPHSQEPLWLAAARHADQTRRSSASTVFHHIPNAQQTPVCSLSCEKKNQRVATQHCRQETQRSNGSFSQRDLRPCSPTTSRSLSRHTSKSGVHVPQSPMVSCNTRHLRSHSCQHDQPPGNITSQSLLELALNTCRGTQVKSLAENQLLSSLSSSPVSCRKVPVTRSHTKLSSKKKKKATTTQKKPKKDLRQDFNCLKTRVNPISRENVSKNVVRSQPLHGLPHVTPVNPATLNKATRERFSPQQISSGNLSPKQLCLDNKTNKTPKKQHLSTKPEHIHTQGKLGEPVSRRRNMEVSPQQTVSHVMPPHKIPLKGNTKGWRVKQLIKAMKVETSKPDLLKHYEPAETPERKVTDLSSAEPKSKSVITRSKTRSVSRQLSSSLSRWVVTPRQTEMLLHLHTGLTPYNASQNSVPHVGLGKPPTKQPTRKSTDSIATGNSTEPRSNYLGDSHRGNYCGADILKSVEVNRSLQMHRLIERHRKKLLFLTGHSKHKHAKDIQETQEQQHPKTFYSKKTYNNAIREEIHRVLNENEYRVKREKEQELRSTLKWITEHSVTEHEHQEALDELAGLEDSDDENVSYNFRMADTDPDRTPRPTLSDSS